jgi:SAM-dependent methyltransferase
MAEQAMDPYGRALIDYLNGVTGATVLVRRDDGVEDEMPVEMFFRGATDLVIDRLALERCRGRVLDVGAGTGLHALPLQEWGHEVCAIDVSPQACEVMRRLGVRDVRCADISGFVSDPFDTVLMLGRSIGMVEDLAGLDHFLSDVRRLVKPAGQVLLNSLDVTRTGNPVHLAYHEANRRAGRYAGEIRIQFIYGGVEGPVTSWLHVDADTLAMHASRFGWQCNALLQEEDGNYLARLTPT